MAADGANLEWTIEAHGRPSRRGPEPIVGLGQRVEERTEDGGRHGKLPVMDVVNAHDVDYRNLTDGVQLLARACRREAPRSKRVPVCCNAWLCGRRPHERGSLV